jgi:molecular chaperone GrpE (heat shock protein)
MSQPTIQPADFADQMKVLAEEAEKLSVDKGNQKPPPTFLQMLRPLVLGLEALSRATVENTMVLARLEAANTTHEILPRFVSEIQEKFDDKNVINQQLFDALHQELKGYKDGFILEVMQKPLVRDLITLYDDLAEIHRQMELVEKGLESSQEAGGVPVPFCGRLKNTGTNLDHVMHSLVEIMARMEVRILEPSTGKLNKTTQRAVSVALADSDKEDGDILRSVKPGFMWRERIVRPEEVVIKKWKEGYLVALNNEPTEGIEVQSGTSDAK